MPQKQHRSSMSQKWILQPSQQAPAHELSQALHISPLLAQLLVNRHITTVSEAGSFLFATLADLHPPSLLKDLEKAVTRVWEAIHKKEKICLYGDYDVDGLTGVALLWRALTPLGANLETYIPDRQADGYGVNTAAVEELAQSGVKLIITIDCGITNISGLSLARRLGVDVVLTDHHQPSSELPPAVAIINPKQPGCNYPFKGLAGVGVAAKLAEGVLARIRAEKAVYEHLDLVCLGTVADISPMIGENRIFVRYGLKQLTNTSKQGIKKLKKSAGLVDGDEVQAWEVGYCLAPRLNAAGRMGDARRALKLLIDDNEDTANMLVYVLRQENQERKARQKEILEEARELFLAQPDWDQAPAIVLANSSWAVGIIGIVASKLVEEFRRPTVLISTSGEPARGSGRSVPKFLLPEALCACREYLEHFGGHSVAAGLSIRAENISGFRQRFLELAKSSLTSEDLKAELVLDRELDIEDLDWGILREVAKLAPFGLGNPEPCFYARGLQVVGYPREVGTDIPGRGHLKLKVRQRHKVWEGIGFGMGGVLPALMGTSNPTVDAAFTLYSNSWQEKPRLQLKLKGLCVNGEILA